MHELPLIAGETVITSDTPPDPLPDASDIKARNVLFCANGNWVENAPFPLVKLESGMLKYLGEPKT